ncbi:MAG: hypothetical protein AAGA81_22370 [Acidobacteriota bacterium]
MAVPGIEAADHPVLVFVPGIMGSNLVHPDGRSAWGHGLDVLWPRDGGREVALPLTASSPDEGQSQLLATSVVESVDLLGYREEFYVRLRRTFEASGYLVGDPKAPDARSNLYLFGHDFRLAPEVLASQLGELLATIRAARGDDRLDVHLMCQSNGGNVCRYFTKYGTASLDEAEGGKTSLPKGVRVSKLALVGTANGGAIRILREFHQGRRIALGRLGRRFAPETILTFRSLFVELPDAEDNFVDESGAPVAADVYSVADWERNRWGVWSAPVQRRLQARRWRGYRDMDAWKQHLQLQLDRARRLRRLLDGDSAGFATDAILQVQSTSFETPRRAVLSGAGAERQTRFWGDEKLKPSKELRAAAMTMGDGHATRKALELSPQEAAVQRPLVLLEVEHAQLSLDDDAHVAVLEFFAQPDTHDD